MQASDLKTMLDETKNLFIHRDNKINEKIQSIGSSELKFAKVICHECNTTLTQKHDRAWEKFSKFSRNNFIPAGGKLRFNRVFPNNTTKHMRHLQLHFVKKLGCIIAEHKVPIEIAPLSQSILNDKIYPNLYLGFATRPSSLQKKVPFISNFDMWLESKQCAFAEWSLIFENLTVFILYAKDEMPKDIRKLLWNPKFSTNRTWIIDRK